ncbi:hypothetical protein Tco_1575793 [Tanacetum coccineum]
MVVPVEEIFADMLKKFDRDDLVKLWDLVKKRYIHDPLVWRLYDTCGVHHVSSVRGHDIFMLVEKEYPLTRGTLGLMMVVRLLVEADSEMSRELLRNIFYQANRPRQLLKLLLLVEEATAGEDYRKQSKSLVLSASEVLYGHCFSRLRLEIKNQLVPATTPLIGFNSEIIWLIGKIQLLVKIGDEEHSTSAWMNFVVVRSPSLYNGIIGRPGVRKLQAVPSTAHGMLKLSVKGGVITLKSSMMVPLECVMVSKPEGNLPATKQTVEERIKVAINLEYLKQTIMIGSTLTEEGRNKLYDLL